MAVTTMRSTSSLAKQLQNDYPALRFAPGDAFHWSPDTTTISYIPDSDDTPDLLHELAHALLKHRDFARDILLLAMERDAWQYARQFLATTYDTPISEDTIDSALDSYRDWLHERSVCPKCKATGIQIKQSTYKCLACTATWTVNDARTCALRRYLA